MTLEPDPEEPGISVELSAFFYQNPNQKKMFTKWPLYTPLIVTGLLSTQISPGSF